jgi:predicted metal-binding membrane protein
MSSCPPTAGVTFDPLTKARRFVLGLVARRPEWGLYAVAACAWLSVGVPPLVGDAASAHAHRHGHHHVAAAEHGTWLADWAHWTLMVLAMMLPIVAPHARRIALRSLWRRRQRALAGFVLGYLALWLGLGAVLTGVVAALDRPRAWPVVPVLLLGAAAWQISRPRRRVLRRCGSLPPGATVGWRADRDSTALGVRFGLRCAFVCGPAMVAMAVSGSAILMAGVLALFLSERARGPNPERRAGRPLEAWGFATLAVAIAIATAPL